MSEFRRKLRYLRDVKGLTQTQVAAHIGYVPSAVSNWESKRGTTPKRPAVEALDKLYGANGGLIAAWESHRQGNEAPVWLRDHKQLASRTVSIEVVTPLIVPGLLQSPMYARHVLSEGLPHDSMDAIEEAVKLRCAQLPTLGNGVRISAIFPEIGVRLVPDGIRKEQAEHLLDLIGSYRVTVHLVPEGSMLAGIPSPFQVYRLDDGTRAITVDCTYGGMLVTDSSKVSKFVDLSRSALGCAASRHETVGRLKEMAT